MNIEYPRGSSDRPVVKLTHHEERALYSGKQLDVIFNLPSGPTRLSILRDNQSGMESQETGRRLVLSEMRVAQLMKSRVGYFPLGTNDGFWLSLQARTRA